MLDDLICEVSGFSVVIQFGVQRFASALDRQPTKGLGVSFDSCVLAKSTPLIKKVINGKCGGSRAH